MQVLLMLVLCWHNWWALLVFLFLVVVPISKEVSSAASAATPSAVLLVTAFVPLAMVTTFSYSFSTAMSSASSELSIMKFQAWDHAALQQIWKRWCRLFFGTFYGASDVWNANCWQPEWLNIHQVKGWPFKWGLAVQSLMSYQSVLPVHFFLVDSIEVLNKGVQSGFYILLPSWKDMNWFPFWEPPQVDKCVDECGEMRIILEPLHHCVIIP